MSKLTHIKIGNTEARHAAELGFGGKLCIHQRRIALVNKAFTPPDDEIIWANRVIAVGEDTGAAVPADQMILERAGFQA